MGPTWGPPGSCRPQMGPMLAPRTLLSGVIWKCMPFCAHPKWVEYSLFLVINLQPTLIIKKCSFNHSHNCYRCFRINTDFNIADIAVDKIMHAKVSKHRDPATISCLFYYLGPLLPTLINFNLGYVVTSIIKCELKLLIHSETSTVAQLKFGNG